MRVRGGCEERWGNSEGGRKEGRLEGLKNQDYKVEIILSSGVEGMVRVFGVFPGSSGGVEKVLS